MDAFSKTTTSVFRGSGGVTLLATATLLSIGLCGTAFAGSGELDAKLAIARAQASVDLVSTENPAATHEPSFTTAQQKLTDARTASSRHDDRQAMWFANEAELLADTTAGAAKLTDLEHTRADVAHDVDILALELRK